MKATTTRRFNFYAGSNYTLADLEKIGQFISDHLDIDIIEGAEPERGVFKSATNIIITIGYEQADTKNGNEEQGVSDNSGGK